MPSKDKEVLKRASQRYKKSAKGRARINATKKVWAATAEGKASKAASDRKWQRTDAGKASAAAKARTRKKERKAWLRDIKSKMCCSECGYDKHPAALQFHHLGDKIDGITRLVCNTSKSYEFIRKEMVKCVVLCANCHLILHDEEHNDRVRARDTTRGRLPNLRGNKASLNHTSHGSKGGAFGLERKICDGKSDVDNKHDYARGNSTLC